MAAIVAVVTSVELLSFTPQSFRADQTLAALGRAVLQAGVRVSQSRSYQGGADLLLLWGPGGRDRVDPMRRQLAAGGHVACFDLAYWDRHRKVRVSIDAPHPQAWVLKRDWPPTRLKADYLRTAHSWNPTGPVILAGIGDKARAQYGVAVDLWEAARRAECRQRGLRVVDRPKLPGGDRTIDQALRGASLVVTWHSNVAVDAIRLGIPVVCQDGAAAAVCPAALPETLAPLPVAIRNRFLANLAHFQWNPQTEAAACWAWLQDVLA